MLYVLNFTVEYRGLSQPELLKIWVKEAQAALAARDQGLVKEIWKVRVTYLTYLNKFQT